MGEQAFAFVNGLLGHPLGLLVLLGYSWALLHHMLGGIRHLIWDTGRGLDIRSVDVLGWLTVVLSPIATAAVWGFGLWLRGVSLQGLW
jgi:succinate dehydrogenase / fumarate reductase cytochrome b subunit